MEELKDLSIFEGWHEVEVGGNRYRIERDRVMHKVYRKSGDAFLLAGFIDAKRNKSFRSIAREVASDFWQD